jgi:hypothetical protein
LNWLLAVRGRHSRRARHSNDQDNIVHNALGDMILDEQILFEVRMAGDDELEQEAATASAMDDLLRRAAEQHRRGRS